MAVDTVPAGFPTIPILATARGNELYAFLKQAFEAVLLDRRDAPSGAPSYMTIRVGDTVISVMHPHDGRPTTLVYPHRPATFAALHARSRDVARADLLHGGRRLTLELQGLPFGGLQ